MRFLVIMCAFVALAGCGQRSDQQVANQQAGSDQAPPTKGVDRHHKGEAAPDVSFKNADGEDTSLTEMAGKPILVNLWASWCAPCVKELPTLDKLSQAQPNLQVAAVSQDMGPHPSVVAFLQSHGISNLEAYQDPKMALSGALGVEVMPTSVLYDSKGKEVWRYVGELDWTSPEAARLLAEADGGAATKP